MGGLVVHGTPGSRVVLTEKVGDDYEEFERFTLAGPTVTLAHLTEWRCDRRARTFVGAVVVPTGIEQPSSTRVHTPSCGRRLSFAGPTQLRLGRPTTCGCVTGGGWAGGLERSASDRRGNRRGAATIARCGPRPHLRGAPPVEARRLAARDPDRLRPAASPIGVRESLGGQRCSSRRFGDPADRRVPPPGCTTRGCACEATRTSRPASRSPGC